MKYDHLGFEMLWYCYIATRSMSNRELVAARDLKIWGAANKDA